MRILCLILIALLLALSSAAYVMGAVLTNRDGCIEYSIWMERTVFTWCPPVSRRY